MSNELNDPARIYVHQSVTPTAADAVRFAPADNLYDAIRSDVAAIGGIDFRPLSRHVDSEPPFNDIDESPFDDE
jgi:hypothetical protein